MTREFENNQETSQYGLGRLQKPVIHLIVSLCEGDGYNQPKTQRVGVKIQTFKDESKPGEVYVAYQYDNENPMIVTMVDKGTDADGNPRICKKIKPLKPNSPYYNDFMGDTGDDKESSENSILERTLGSLANPYVSVSEVDGRPLLTDLSNVAGNIFNMTNHIGIVAKGLIERPQIKNPDGTNDEACVIYPEAVIIPSHRPKGKGPEFVVAMPSISETEWEKLQELKQRLDSEKNEQKEKKPSFGQKGYQRPLYRKKYRK